MPHEDGPSTPFLARIDTGLRSAFGSSRSEAMPDAGPSPGSSLRAEEGSSILEAVRRLQAAEPTTLGVGALTSDVYTEAVVRVLTAKLGAQRPDLGAGAKEVREALSVLKVESARLVRPPAPRCPLLARATRATWPVARAAARAARLFFRKTLRLRSLHRTRR